MSPEAEALDTSVVVVKYGGAAFDSTLLPLHAARNLARLVLSGRRVVLVHGGGRAVTEEAARRGLPTRFVDGLRATDKEMLDVVRTVMVGRINKDLVGRLGRSGVRAIGLSGEDGGLIRARTIRRGDGATDLGYVGEPTEVRTDVLHMVWRAGMLPVVASVAADEAGVPHNINADSAAAALAAALFAERLVYVTDVDGLLRDPAVPDSRVVRMSTLELANLLRSRPPTDGMLPKLSAALDALRSGVGQVRIVGSRQKDAVLVAATTDSDIGTTLGP